MSVLQLQLHLHGAHAHLDEVGVLLDLDRVVDVSQDGVGLLVVGADAVVVHDGDGGWRAFCMFCIYYHRPKHRGS